MDNNVINIIITVVVVVAFIFVYIVLFTSFFDNFSTAKYEKSIKIKKKYSVETLRLLKKICYQFRHRSFESWLAWLRIQESDIQNIALNKLIQHLNGDVIEWDESVTPDIIMNLTIFKGIKNLSFIFPNILTKIKEASQTILVNKFLFYKSTFIPFITLYPSLGLEYLEVEVEELTSSEELGSIDKKKFIIEQIQRINTHFNEGRIYDQTLLNLLLDIICNNDDSIVRWEAFEVLNEFDSHDLHQASLKILPIIVENSEVMDEVISQIFKSLIKDLVVDINKPEIFSIFKDAIHKPSLKPVIITTLGNLLMGINSLFNMEHLFAIYKLDESEGKELVKILAKRNTLTESEVEFIEEKQPKFLNYKEVIEAENIKLDDFPIPTFQKDYIDSLLKKLGKTPFEKKEGSSSIYESAMLRGPNKFDKAYICRLFCLLRNKFFKHIDLAKVITDNKNDPGTALENQMKYEQENTMFFISSIEQVYGKAIQDEEFEKHLKKIKQILKVYSSNKDYFLVSSSEDPVIMQEESGQTFIDIQADNIFKNIIDFNLPGQYDQLKLLESMIQKMNKKRIRDGEGILNQLLKLAKERSMIEGYYTAAKFAKLMIVLFTEYESIEPILNLEEKYKFLLNESKKKKAKK